MSQRKLSLFPEGAHQREVFLGSPQGSARCQGKVREVRRAQIGHGVILPVAPDVFGGIEFWCIGRESRQEDVAVLFVQEGPDLATAMNRQTIPDDQQLPSDLAAQAREEVEHLGGANRARIQPEVKPPPGNTGNDRKLLPAEVELQLRGLATRRPCPADMGTLGNPALVYEDDGSVFPEGFFLRAGHLYRFHRRMASSSRSTAFLEGRWQLHPRWRRTLQTWPGW